MEGNTTTSVVPLTTSPVDVPVITGAAVDKAHENNFYIDFNIDVLQLMDWATKTFHHDTDWLQAHQVFAAGLCAIVAATLALIGSGVLARGNILSGLKLDQQKSDREEQFKLKIWNGKKRFLVFDILNAVTDASKHIHYTAGYIHHFDDDDQPTEYMIYKKELDFEEIDKALDRVSVRSSFYPLVESELRYLSDDEMSITKRLDFYVAFLRSRSKDVQEMWGKFMQFYTPEEVHYSISQPPEDAENAIALQNNMYALVKAEVKRLVDEVKELEKISLKFAKALAPEIGKEWEEAQKKTEAMKAKAEQE